MISIFLSKIYPLICCFSMIASLTMFVINKRRYSAGLRIAFLAISLAVLFIPVRGLYLYKYIYGVFGSLSISSVLLILSFCVNSVLNKSPVPYRRERSAILYVIAVAGLALYPTALGFIPVDLYHFGYSPGFLLILILVLTILAWMASFHFAAVLPVVAVIAFNLKILESENLWDYLVDPFIVFYAWGWVIYTIVLTFNNRIKTNKIRKVQDNEYP